MKAQLDTLKATGKLTIEKVKANGEVEVTKTNNLVVTTGLRWIAKAMDANTAETAMGWMAVGTNGTDPIDGHTQLLGEIARVPMTQNLPGSGSTITYQATFGSSEANGSIQEAGIFNSASTNGGEMLCRTKFGVITKEAGDTITITWEVTIGNA